jgi:SAM-dependent methyltransferase
MEACDPAPLATRADRHRLYELAVQCPEAEIDFVDATFQTLRQRPARLLREDFCGTAGVCCEWVRRRGDNRALGVDIDGAVLDWGRRHNLASLPAGQHRRVELRQADVRRPGGPAPDLVLAMNFSYWLFTTRAEMLDYFRSVHRSLAPGGVFFLDAYGGYDAFRVIEEQRQVEQDGWCFTYLWEQESYDPVSGRMTCSIHFSFPDGSRLTRAFHYEWRLWTLPEIRELLAEAGFRSSQVYWQGWDEHGEADGVFLPVTEGQPEAGWICYLSALP